MARAWESCFQPPLGDNGWTLPHPPPLNLNRVYGCVRVCMNVRKGNLPQRKQFAIRRQSYCIVSKSYSSFHFRCEITKKLCTLAFCFGRCLSYLSVKISNLIGHVSEGVGAVIHHFFKFINSKKLLFQVVQRCLLNLQLPLFAWIRARWYTW